MKKAPAKYRVPDEFKKKNFFFSYDRLKDAGERLTTKNGYIRFFIVLRSPALSDVICCQFILSSVKCYFPSSADNTRYGINCRVAGIVAGDNTCRAFTAHIVAMAHIVAGENSCQEC